MPVHVPQHFTYNLVSSMSISTAGSHGILSIMQEDRLTTSFRSLKSQLKLFSGMFLQSMAAIASRVSSLVSRAAVVRFCVFLACRLQSKGVPC